MAFDPVINARSLYLVLRQDQVTVIFISGYRSVPLKNEYSEPLELAALFVWIDMRNPKVRLSWSFRFAIHY